MGVNPSGSSARPMREILLKLIFRGRKANNGNGTYDSLSAFNVNEAKNMIVLCIYCRAADRISRLSKRHRPEEAVLEKW